MKTTINDKAVVLTGGPGMGKTAMLDQLAEMGYAVVPESGRAIIQEQIRIGGKRLPWEDRQDYGLEMFQVAVTDYNRVLKSGKLHFFDRAIPDVIGYLRVCQLPVPDHLWSAASTLCYHKQVFITPPWKEIYHNDSERKQTYAQAEATYQAMLEVYQQLNYILIEVPKLPVEKRAAFVIDALALK